MINWIKNNRESVIRNSFLFPILLVVIMSISHVVSWYDIGNPVSWAIYLSIAVEIFALASVSAASIKMNKGSIWFLFCLVTLIQIIGNVFYEYKEISLTDSGFIYWVELISPFFEDWDSMDHRRFLAIIQGGTLPIMSLTSLHFYIKFNDNLTEEKEKNIVQSVSSEYKEGDALEIVNSFNNAKEDTSQSKNEMFESNAGLPVKNIKADKGNKATKAQTESKINPNTGKLKKKNDK